MVLVHQAGWAAPYTILWIGGSGTSDWMGSSLHHISTGWLWYIRLDRLAAPYNILWMGGCGTSGWMSSSLHHPVNGWLWCIRGIDTIRDLGWACECQLGNTRGECLVQKMKNGVNFIYWYLEWRITAYLYVWNVTFILSHLTVYCYVMDHCYNCYVLTV